MRRPAPPLIGFRPLSVFSRTRGSAAASFCLKVAISAVAAGVLTAAVVRSTLITSMRRDRADCAVPLSGLAKIRTGTCWRRDRINRAFTPSGFAKIFRDNSGVPSRHWPARRDRFYQLSICCDEFVPIVAVGIVEQFAQGQDRERLRFVHARERMAAQLTNG